MWPGARKPHQLRVAPDSSGEFLQPAVPESRNTSVNGGKGSTRTIYASAPREVLGARCGARHGNTSCLTVGIGLFTMQLFLTDDNGRSQRVSVAFRSYPRR